MSFELTIHIKADERLLTTLESMCKIMSGAEKENPTVSTGHENIGPGGQGCLGEILPNIAPAVQEFVDQHYGSESASTFSTKQDVVPTREEIREDIKARLIEDIPMTPFNPTMPRGIDPDDECIRCPTCNMLYSNIYLDHTTSLCPNCRAEASKEAIEDMPEEDTPTQESIGYDVTLVVPEEPAEESESVSKSEPKFVRIPNTPVDYYDDGEAIELLYSGSNVGKYSWDIIYTLADMDQADRKRELDQITKGLSNVAKTRTALNKTVAAFLVGQIGSNEEA
ncbi:hypothetical protein [Methanococcoides sp. AM1]|uniref:hypothetical protein n=1 Tax=Methanococcoides sp. AM1 TaxID=1201011 RepID=UPI001083C4A5|nr:hypothetical protein [Methanococcoides sp. AM1]